MRVLWALYFITCVSVLFILILCLSKSIPVDIIVFYKHLLLVQLILRPRKEILDSLTSKDDNKEKEVDKSDEQEASASQSQLSSSSEDDSSELGLLSYIV